MNEYWWILEIANVKKISRSRGAARYFSWEGGPTPRGRSGFFLNTFSIFGRSPKIFPIQISISKRRSGPPWLRPCFYTFKNIYLNVRLFYVLLRFFRKITKRPKFWHIYYQNCSFMELLMSILFEEINVRRTTLLTQCNQNNVILIIVFLDIKDIFLLELKAIIFMQFL